MFLRMASFDMTKKHCRFLFIVFYYASGFDKELLALFRAFLGIGIIHVDPHVVVETSLVLVAGIAVHFYCAVQGLRLYIFSC